MSVTVQIPYEEYQDLLKKIKELNFLKENAFTVAQSALYRENLLGRYLRLSEIDKSTTLAEYMKNKGYDVIEVLPKDKSEGEFALDLSEPFRHEGEAYYRIIKTKQ